LVSYDVSKLSERIRRTRNKETKKRSQKGSKLARKEIKDRKTKEIPSKSS
jgi:hypothetical protein